MSHAESLNGDWTVIHRSGQYSRELLFVLSKNVRDKVKFVILREKGEDKPFIPCTIYSMPERLGMMRPSVSVG